MHLLSKIDIFKQPVQLNINKDNNVSTCFGKLITYFMIFYTLYTLFRSDLVLHQNPSIKLENLRPLKRPPLNFNNLNFTFAVGLYDLETGGYQVDSTIFSYSAELFLINNSNGIYKEIPLKMKICEDEDFMNAGENFQKTDRRNLFCFHLKNETIDLYGALNENSVEFLSLQLNRCQNNSEQNFICKSPEEQENFIKNKFQDIIFQNDAIEYSDYLNPVKKDIVKQYVLLDASLFKTIKTELKHISFLSDDGFFFENMKREDSYGVDSITYDFQTNNLESNQPLMRLEIHASNQETIHSRKYQHIQDLLAEMGGILNIFLIVGLLIINIEVPYILTKEISSQLYSYNIEKNDEKNEILKEEENEQNKAPFDLSISMANMLNETTKSSNITDFHPKTDLKLIAKKKIIIKNEPLTNTKELSISSFSPCKENDTNTKTFQKENLVYSNINRNDSYLTFKIPTLKGDEETIMHENSEEEEFSNSNIRMQRRSGFSSFAAAKFRKANTIINTGKKKK